MFYICMYCIFISHVRVPSASVIIHVSIFRLPTLDRVYRRFVFVFTLSFPKHRKFSLFEILRRFSPELTVYSRWLDSRSILAVSVRLMFALQGEFAASPLTDSVCYQLTEPYSIPLFSQLTLCQARQRIFIVMRPAAYLPQF